MREHDTSLSPAMQPQLRKQAYIAGDNAIYGRMSIQMMAYYKFLIRNAFSPTWTIATYDQIAQHLKLSRRSIERYDARLVELGLITLQKFGHSYRRIITAMCPELAVQSDSQYDNEYDSQSDNLSYSPYDEPDSIVALDLTALSGSTFNSTQSLIQKEEEGPAEAAVIETETHPKPKYRKFHDTLIPDTDATARLEQIGVFSWRKLHEYSNVPIELVDEALAYAQHQGKTQEKLPGYVLSLLADPNGIWRNTHPTAPRTFDTQQPTEADPDPVCTLDGSYSDGHRMSECRGVHGRLGYPFIIDGKPNPALRLDDL